MNRITSGWINGFIGMLIFSASLPATRIAVSDFSPLFLTSVRGTIAAVLALFFIGVFREKKPKRNDLLSLTIVALAVVIGFPLLTSLALQYITSAQSLIYIGLLPLSTAAFGVLRGAERPRWTFWIFSILGSSLVVAYALSQGFDGSLTGNACMLAAIIVCGLGYAEGATLSRKLGGWQVISWALVLALPLMFALSVYSMPETFDSVSPSGWAGLLYVSIFSMFIGFIFWYRGLSQGGIAAIGQLQLLQPFFGLMLAASLLGEKVELTMILVTIGVIASVIASKRFA